MHTKSRPLASLCLVLAVVLTWTCSSSSTDQGNQVPTSLVVTPNALSFDALNDTRTLTGIVRDQNNSPISGAAVSWGIDNDDVATVSSTGAVTSAGNGTATVTASSGSLSAQATINVAQVANALAKPAGVSGDNQSAQVGQSLPDPLVVQVNDRLGSPIEGVTVNFTPGQESGSVDPTSGTTGADGRVQTQWTLGTKAGAQSVAAAPASGSGSETFQATAMPGPADDLVKVSGDNQTAPTNGAVADSLVVRATDEFGNGVAGHTVNFSATSGGGSVSPTSAMTDNAGRAATKWTLGATVGAQTAQASGTKPGGALPLDGSPVTFTATGVSTTMEVHDGQNQTGLAGKPVNIPPSVRVTDLATGNPVQNVQVTFNVASGGGSASGTIDLTDANGVAEVGSWTLGGATGANQLTATASPVAQNSPITFSATGATAQYNIEIRAVGTITMSEQAALNNAEAKWEQLIFGDVPSQAVNIPADGCINRQPAINETVDDIVIFARLDSMIDGPGNILGRAGPCAVRSGTLLPAAGVMFFDSDDIADMEINGTLERVMLHEMGHALGYGTIWESRGFLELESCTGAQNQTPVDGQDTYFDGSLAIKAFNRIGGASYSQNEVPVENGADGPPFAQCPGSRDAHWRESVLGNELMTPFLGTATDPLSYLSVASMGDLGYQVNYSDAHTYTLILPGPAALTARGAGVRLLDDVYQGPIWVADPSGRVVRVIRPKLVR